jgi:acyl carrier protein
MKRIKLKLYKVLRNVGLERNEINLFSIFNEELKLDKFDEVCYLYYLENSFNISIPDKDVPKLRRIDNTIDYLYNKTSYFGGLN